MNDTGPGSPEEHGWVHLREWDAWTISYFPGSQILDIRPLDMRTDAHPESFPSRKICFGDLRSKAFSAMLYRNRYLYAVTFASFLQT